ATWDDRSQLRRLLLAELDGALQETELCYRQGQRFAPLLSAVALDEGPTGETLEIAEDAVYVISGGTNGVGLEIARHLATRGCRKLVLMGITPLPPKERWTQALAEGEQSAYVHEKLRALLELDGQVEHLEVYSGSLAARDALRHYFVRIRATLGPIRGVVHAAAVYSDAETPGFATKGLERMRQVWEPKADGLENLHAVFKADPLDFFVTFASM